MRIRLVALVLTICVGIVLASGRVGLGDSSRRHRGRNSASSSTSGTAPVTWGNMVNCGVSGATLQKSAGCSGCATSTASSMQSMSSSGGYLQITVDNTQTDRYCGLSYQGNSPNYNSIDYAFHLSAIADLEVREDGAYRTDVRYAVGAPLPSGCHCVTAYYSVHCVQRRRDLHQRWANADADPHPHSNTEGNPDANANTDTDANANTDTQGDTDTDAHPNTDTHPDADPGFRQVGDCVAVLLKRNDCRRNDHVDHQPAERFTGSIWDEHFIWHYNSDRPDYRHRPLGPHHGPSVRCNL
jgi:hypothetical protein